MEKEMNLLFSANKNFFDELKDMLFSVANFNKEFLNVYMMNIELDEKDIEELSDFVEKKCHGKLIPLKFDVTAIKGNIPVTDNEGSYFGLETYARLFGPYYVLENMERLLYLDVDMLCNGSLEELYNMDFEGNTFVACEDLGIDLESKIRLSLPEDYTYINAGVLLINIQAFKKALTMQELANKIISQAEVLKYCDQDFINKNFKDSIKVVSNKFNFLTKSLTRKDVDYEPVIYHYAGSVKPWHDNVNRFEPELLEPYYMNLLREGRIDKLVSLYEKHQKNRV